MEKLGHLIFKANINRLSKSESPDYYYTKLSTPEGIQDLLFTSDEIERALSRAKKNPEDCGY